MNNTTFTAVQDKNDGVDIELMIRAIVYVITCILGFVGNSLVLIILKAKGRRRTVNDIFIMNLATSDMTFIFFVPVLIYKLFATFTHSLFFCHVIMPLMTVTFFVSVFTLSSMAVHRCRAIIHPFLPDVKRRTVYVWITLIWLFSVLIMVPMMAVNTVDDPPLECKETWPPKQKRIYTAALMVLQFLLPMTVITGAYALICADLFKSKNRTPAMGSLYQRSSGSSDRNKNRYSSKSKQCKSFSSKKRTEDIRIVKTLAVIVVLFAVCTLPGQIAWMLIDFGNKYHRNLAVDVFFKIYIIFAVFHSCWNPIVYGTLTRQFRRGYLRYMRKICCWHSGRYSLRRYTSRGPMSRRMSPSNSRMNSGHLVHINSDEIIANGEKNNLISLNILVNNSHTSEIVVEKLYCA